MCQNSGQGASHCLLSEAAPTPRWSLSCAATTSTTSLSFFPNATPKYRPGEHRELQGRDAATWPTQRTSWSICVHLVTSSDFTGSVFQILTFRIDGRAQNKPPDILKPLGLLSSISSQLTVSQGNKVQCSNARGSARRSPWPEAEQATAHSPGISPKSRERTAQVMRDSFAPGADCPTRPEPGVPRGIKASTIIAISDLKRGEAVRAANTALPHRPPQRDGHSLRDWLGSPWGSAPCLLVADVPPAIHRVSGEVRNTTKLRDGHLGATLPKRAAGDPAQSFLGFFSSGSPLSSS